MAPQYHDEVVAFLNCNSGGVVGSDVKELINWLWKGGSKAPWARAKQCVVMGLLSTMAKAMGLEHYAVAVKVEL